ncbi:ecto-ADP-ribosyltransferase 5-like [Anomaloglossus baeobatrachus]
MMPDAFDDQYLCCEDKMEKLMPKILEEERKNKQFDEMWIKATIHWSRHNLNLPSAFKDEYGVAVYLCTLEFQYPICNQLNGNISIAGRSRDYYMQHFHFKALHFYLTRALQVLSRGCAKKYVAYRGSRQIYNVSSELRFGEFAASSLDKDAAASSGTKSFFNISTCFGVDSDDLLKWGHHDILIPVAEKFRNIKKDGNSYTLESSGELCSYFNCAYLGGECDVIIIRSLVYKGLSRAVAINIQLGGVNQRYWTDTDFIHCPDADLSLIASNGQPLTQVGYKEVVIKVGRVEFISQGLVVVDEDKGEYNSTMTLDTHPVTDWNTERQLQYKKVQECDKLDDQWEAQPFTVLPSNHDNRKACTIVKDGGKTCTTVSRDNLKVCPAKLLERVETREVPQPMEEVETKICTILAALGDDQSDFGL